MVLGVSSLQGAHPVGKGARVAFVGHAAEK